MQRLSDTVVTAIQKDIDSGKFPVGEKMPSEPLLMVQYGVGRSSIREAIKTLAHTGVLKVQQGDGTYVQAMPVNETLVQRLKRSDVAEINSARALIETELVRLAVINRSDADLEAMAAALQQRKKMIAARKYKPCADADIAFHLAVAKAAGNKVLYELYEGFTKVIREFFTRRDARQLIYFADSHANHEQLFEAIKTRNMRKAGKLLQTILDNNY